MSFTVAIVGRPNVGKSTLFNRLVGRRLALVDDRPGVTRDRREGEGRLGDLSFKVIDTAGLEDAERESLSARMQAQTAAAIAQADAVLFLVDARAGATPADRAFANLVRKSGKPAILVANKSEGRAGEAGVLESYALASANRSRSAPSMAKAWPNFTTRCASRCPKRRHCLSTTPRPIAAPEERPIRIAIVGRPNTGKSTLINRLLGEERLLTGPEAGITRDAIAVDLTWRGRRLRIHDTAGLRRRSRIEDKLEKLSVADALNAIRFAEVVIVLIDAQAAVRGAGHPHCRPCRAGRPRGRHRLSTNGIWSTRRQARCRACASEVDRLLPQIKGVPVVALSAKSGKGVDRLMAAVMEAARGLEPSRADGGAQSFSGAGDAGASAAGPSRPPFRLDYITQPKSRPPTFVLFSSRANALPETYRRYLVNGLRENFDLPGTPIRLDGARQGQSLCGQKAPALTPLPAYAGVLEFEKFPGAEIVEFAGFGKARQAQIEDFFRHLFRRRQRHRVLARHDLRPHAGARRAGIEEIDANRRCRGFRGIGSRQRVKRGLRCRIGPAIGAG